MNRFENIPKELQSLFQWVVVDADSKIPRNVYTGKAASSSDPSTWSSFDSCVQDVEDGLASNIGFVFHDNGLVGIDIDAGYDEDGFLSPLAADILSVCHSYTERSRSGRGFHIIVMGNIPFKGRNGANGVEIYKDSRYFITTGDVLLYRDIVENQTAIDYILEKYFPAEMRSTNERESQLPRVYSPQWEIPQNGRINLKPIYPTIPQGSRNICLTSLAGMMHTHGYRPDLIYEELCNANRTACDPPLDDWEIQSIVRSVTRYRR